MHAGMLAGLFIGVVAFAWAQGNAADISKTGTVSGSVMESPSGEPVRHAIVILRSGQAQAIGATTDADGKFTPRDLEPGTYTASADRDGYVLNPDSARQALHVRAGESVADLKLEMARTGVISGRVLDADGEPVAGASVQVSPAQKNRGAPGGGGTWASTNDKGEYRAFHIAAGEYKISVTYNRNARLQGMDIRMQTPPSGPPLSGYPAVYYPGTLNAAEAVAITVKAGSEMAGFDVHLVRQQAVTVRGRVTGQGSPSALSFTFLDLQPLGGVPGPSWNTIVRTESGNFELLNVIPGKYQMSATSATMNEPARMTGRRTLVVGSVDLDDVQITVGPLEKLSGRIAVPPDEKIPAGLIVMLESREPGDVQPGGISQVGTDGRFVMPEVPRGEYFAIVSSSAHGSVQTSSLYVSAIRQGDVDALVKGVSVGAGSFHSLQIVLKAHGGSLELRVVDEKGQPNPAAKVMLVPDAPKQQQIALYGECQTGGDGTCQIAGITPGDYHAYAFSAEPGIDHREPDFLKPFEKYGKAIQVAEGDTLRLDLMAAPLQ